MLALQLPFAIVPLVMFTRDKAKMRALVAPGWLTLVAGVATAIIIALNMKLLWDIAGDRTLQESRFIPANAKSNACGVAPFSARSFRRSHPSLMSGGESRIWLQMT